MKNIKMNAMNMGERKVNAYEKFCRKHNNFATFWHGVITRPGAEETWNNFFFV